MKKDIALKYSFIFLTFLFFFIYFSQIHPLIPFDNDDWVFLSQSRSALIDFSEWNATRIFPEMFMPFCGDIAAYIIYPITGDYLGAQTIVHASVVALFISFYAFCFFRLLVVKFELTTSESILYTIFFLLLHFLIFRTTESDNEHLFYSQDVTCYYCYDIPNMLCASLVLLLLSNNWLHRIRRFSPIKKGMLFVVLYLALCSNLYCSAILILFLASRLLLLFPWKDATKESILQFFKRNLIDWFLIFAWIFVGMCETQGGRAQMHFEKHYYYDSFIVQTIDVLQNFASVHYNILFLVILITSILFFLFLYYKERNFSKLYVILFINIFLSFGFIVLLNTQIYPHYARRSDILFSMFFPLLSLVIFSFVKIRQIYPNITAIFPILFLIIYSQICSSTETFRDLSIDQHTSDFDVNFTDIIRVERNAINRIIVADNNNQQDSILIYVPDCGKGNTWPWIKDTFTRMNMALQKHRIISTCHDGKFVIEDADSYYKWTKEK